MLELEVIDSEQMRRATSGSFPLPLEQSSAWERFAAKSGHRCWKRLQWVEDKKIKAVVSLYEYEARGIPFLWARQGPVWLKNPTPSAEAELRESLREYVKRESPKTCFIRLHSWYGDNELHSPFQAIGYDRTVVIDSAQGNREKALSLLPKSGQRLIKRADKKAQDFEVEIIEETGLSKKEFRDHYKLLEETAERDGFTPHPFEHYWSMMQELGSEHMRLFCLRVDSELACWDLVGINGSRAWAFYGASSALSRTVNGAALLDFEVATMLGKEGISGLDLMGIHSPMTPELYDVGRYKMQFAQNYTDVPGMWDFPVKPLSYRIIERAVQLRQNLKHRLEKNVSLG